MLGTVDLAWSATFCLSCSTVVTAARSISRLKGYYLEGVLKCSLTILKIYQMLTQLLPHNTSNDFIQGPLLQHQIHIVLELVVMGHDQVGRVLLVFNHQLRLVVDNHSFPPVKVSSQVVYHYLLLVVQLAQGLA